MPGLLAKDVIDLQVGVRELADADDPAFVRALRDLGFHGSEGNDQDTVHDWAQDPGDWQKRFHGSADGRVAHVHVRRVGSRGTRWPCCSGTGCALTLGGRRLRRPQAGAGGDAVDHHRLHRGQGAWVARALDRARAWAGETQWTA